MHQCGHVDELENDSDFNMFGRHSAGSTSSKDREDWANAFTARITDVVDVGLHGRVESANLIADLGFHFLEFFFYHFEWYLRIGAWFSH